jgi:CheY-like chemotaxis protein
MQRTILSIEDDEVTQLLHKIEFEDAELIVNVVEAWSGQIALDYFEALNKEEDAISKLPALILLDLNMPVMGGWEFLELFSTQYPHFVERIKIFVLSSSINPEDRIRASKEPLVQAFLYKPLNEKDIDILRKAISE